MQPMGCIDHKPQGGQDDTPLISEIRRPLHPFASDRWVVQKKAASLIPASAGISRTTLPSLMDGDHLALKISIPEHHRPVMVKLAKVNWVQGGRFGVELLMMDADERGRLSHLSTNTSPWSLNFRIHDRS